MKKMLTFAVAMVVVVMFLSYKYFYIAMDEAGMSNPASFSKALIFFEAFLFALSIFIAALTASLIGRHRGR